MQKSKLVILVLVALFMALGASTIANKVMSGKLAKENQGYDDSGEQVVVALTDIRYAQLIRAEDVMLKQIPSSLIPADIITTLDAVVGKVAKGDIFQGELLLSKKIADRQEGTILASLVKENMRAVTVRVDDVTGVAGFLLPGNRVDVLGSRMEKNRSITRTVLENIRVLAVDQTVEAEKDKPVLVRAVTLEVSPSDSEQLFQAIQEGKINLTLRNPSDSGTKLSALEKNQAKQASVQEATAKVAATKKKSVKSRPKKRRPKAKPVAKSPVPQVNVGQPPPPAAKVVWRPVEVPVKQQEKPVTKTITVIRGTTTQNMTLIDKK